MNNTASNIKPQINYYGMSRALDSRTLIQLFQLWEERLKIAKYMNSCDSTDEEKVSANNLIENINEKIKQLLLL